MERQPHACLQDGPATLYGLLIDGQWIEGAGPRVAVRDKYRLAIHAQVTTADAAQVRQSVDVAHAAFRAGAPGPYERGAILERAAVLLEQRAAQFVRAMQVEAGFTESDASGEVRRCIQTLKLSAEEARRLAGDVIPLAGAPAAAGRTGYTLRVPLGVVLAVTPFNSPLNTVTHKVAPALAAGNAVILKPSSHTPLTACLLAEVLLEAGVPPGLLGVLHGSGDVVALLQADARVRFFAFTGSTEVGRKIQQGAAPSSATTPASTRRCPRSSTPVTARRGRSAPRCSCCWCTSPCGPRSSSGWRPWCRPCASATPSIRRPSWAP